MTFRKTFGQAKSENFEFFVKTGRNDKKTLCTEDAEIQATVKNIEDELKDNGRVIIRPSGTEPLIRVMIEGKEQQDIEEKATKLADLIKIKLD